MGGRSFTVRRCKTCGARFLSPNWVESEIPALYDEAYYGHNKQKFGALVERILDCFRAARALFIAGYVPDGGKILDIGCGSGRILHFLQRHGNFKVYGIEVPGIAAERTARIPEIQLKIGPLEPGDYPSEFFDAVTLFHVFEHLPDPANTLSTISAILRKGGVCVVSFPNIDRLQARIFRENGRILIRLGIFSTLRLGSLSQLLPGTS
jgi:2-polyprenyl-3-methyl-5-hydroxy-6-metoxy-1,4-benzoquinol methylase